MTTTKKHSYEYYIVYRNKFRRKNRNLFEFMSDPEPLSGSRSANPDPYPHQNGSATLTKNIDYF